MKKALTYFLILLAFSSCKDKNTKIPVIDPAFTNYISGFTSGVISGNSTLTIQMVSDLSAPLREELLTKDLK